MIEWAKDAVKSTIKVRGAPVLAIFILALASSSIYVLMKEYSGNPHLRSAKKLYEEGDFAAAIKEVEAYLVEEPLAIDGLVMLGDSHAALADVSRWDTEKYMKHVCTAVKAYKKSLDIKYNNNVASKLWMLEEKTQGLVDSKGRLYGGCSSREIDGEEAVP